MTAVTGDGAARSRARRNTRTLWWLAGIALALSMGTVLYVGWMR